MKAYNDTTYAILGILTTDCRSGYAIKQFIDRSLTHFWKVSYGQIYPTLKLIVDEGLAEVIPSSTTGKKEKNEYQLTTKGMDTLKQWLAQPVEQAPVERNEVLLKLFFGSYQSTEQSAVLLLNYKEQLEFRYSTYETIEQGILSHNNDDKDAPYWLSTLDYGKRVTKAAIEWCEQTLEMFKPKEENK